MSKNNSFDHPESFRVSQNFLTSSSTIKRIINLSNINQSDHVIEIGAGKGHITNQLIARCGKLTAIEIDQKLFYMLEAKFEHITNTNFLCCDFLKYSLPKTPYKVFANIPFNRTTEIIRKLINDKNSPDDAWLVVEKGAAKRFMGKPYESLLSLLIKPFFDIKIKYYFKKEDFHPAPSVEPVLLHISKKLITDIADVNRYLYNRFISNCFNKPRILYKYLTKKQIFTALKNEKLSCDIISRETLYIQWLCLFRCCLKFGRLKR